MMREWTEAEEMYLQLMELFHHDDAYFIDELIEVMTDDELYTFMTRVMTKQGIEST